MDDDRDGGVTLLRPGSHERHTRDALLRRYALHPDPHDLEALVVSYRPLAHALAHRIGRGSNREDLEQVACEGLIKAIRRFDPDRGFAFMSFAVPTILGELRRHRRETAWPAHVPRPLQERIQNVRAAAERRSARCGRDPTIAELAAELECEEALVLEALTAASSLNVLPLDAPRRADGDDDGSLADEIGAADPAYDRVEYRAAIEAAAPKLSDEQRTVVRLRFAEDLTQREIALRLRMSRSEVGRTLAAAQATLRSTLDVRPAA